MLIRFFADIHLHEWPDFSRLNEDGINSRLADQLEALERLSAVPSFKFKRVPDIAIIAGDITHKRGALTPAVIHAAKVAFERFSRSFKEVLVIPGNHDYPLKSGPAWLNSTTIFEGLPNVKVFNEPIAYAVEESGIIHFVPWMPDSEAMKEAFLQSVGSVPSILVSHLAIHGARLDNGFIYEGGLAVSDLCPASHKAVFLGDFHHAQTFAGTNVHYIGAPYPMTRADVSLKGSVMDAFFDPAGNKFDYCWTQDTAGKRMIRTDDMKEAEEATAKGHYVSFVASGKAEVRQAQALGLPIEFRPPETTQKRLNVKADSDITEIVGAYFESLEEKELGGRERQEEVKALALEVVQEAQNAKAFTSMNAAKNLIIGELHAENFLSYERLDVNFEGQGLILLEGINEDDLDAESNGAGKSAVIEAVVYGLFGETLRGVPVSEIQKKDSKEAMSVSLTVYVDGRRVDIKRTRQGSKSAFLYSYDDLTGNHSPDPKEAQRELDALTGWNIDLFRQTAIFGQNSEFAFSVATDLQRKELLEKLLPDGNRFAAIYPFAVNKDTEIAGVLAKKRSKVESLESCLKADEEAKARAKERADGFEAEKVSDMLAVSQSIKDHTAKKEGLTKRVETAKQAVSNLENEKKEMLSESGVLAEEANKEKVSTAKQKIQAAKYKKDTEHTRIGELEQEAENIMRQSGGNCPTCKQDVPPEHAETIAKKAAEEINRRRKLMAEYDAQIEAAETELATAEKALEDTRIRIKVKQESLSRIDRDITDARKEEAQAVMDLSLAQTAVENAESRKKEIEGRSNTWLEVVKEHEEKIVAGERELKQANGHIEELTGMKDVSEGVLKLFGNQGLKTFLFDALAPAITEKTNEALAILSSGSLAVKIATERRGQNEKISFAVTNNFGAPGMKGQSGGQRRKIDIALLWAMASIVEARINVLFIDEAFDALDTVAGARVSELLKTRQADKGTIINITHRQEFKHHFPTVWSVRFKGGKSVLERNTSDEATTAD